MSGKPNIVTWISWQWCRIFYSETKRNYWGKEKSFLKWKRKLLKRLFTGRWSCLQTRRNAKQKISHLAETLYKIWCISKVQTSFCSARTNSPSVFIACMSTLGADGAVMAARLALKCLLPWRALESLFTDYGASLSAPASALTAGSRSFPCALLRAINLRGRGGSETSSHAIYVSHRVFVPMINTLLPPKNMMSACSSFGA